MKPLSIFICVFLFQSVGMLAANQSPFPLDVTIDAHSGSYSVYASEQHWTLSGSIRQPMKNVHFTQGHDSIGWFKAVSFTWQNQVCYLGTILWYRHRPVVLFNLSLPQGATQSIASFPDFTALPDSLHKFSYKNDVFAAPQFSLEQTSTPWLLFNDDADACVISPASDFIVAKLTGDGETHVSSGLNAEVQQFPEHFTHSTILVIDKGIRHTWDVWGNVLRAIYHRNRSANDKGVLLNRFGYWTDNGAAYYYQYDTVKGYSGTLLALKQRYKQEKIPLGYMQLDSWWYEKSIYDPDGRPDADHKNPALPFGAWNRYGGLMQYTADPFLFPHGLSAFQKSLGIPLVTHSRWVDPTSPYRQRYKISGYASVDSLYWKARMDYLKRSGVVCYEQDWLNYIYNKSPEMISTLSIGNAFTDGMARAAQADSIDLQYCMAMPRFFLQGVRYNNLTTIRTSNDRFEPAKWKWFIFTSQLGYEMGIWPWCDVFKSAETGNMIVSVLSAGVVGTGDAMGMEDRTNILKACRADGVLVKPDVPLLPLDEDYIQLAHGEKKPLLAYTYTQHASIKTGYVFAFANGNITDRQFSFQPSTMGFNGKIVVFNPLQHTVHVMRATDTFQAALPQNDYTYYILAPITHSGIAFLGDANKIAATGKKRIVKIADLPDKLQVKVRVVPGDSSIVLQGYYQHPFADQGFLSLKNSTTHLFTLTLKAPFKSNTVTINFKPKR